MPIYGTTIINGVAYNIYGYSTSSLMDELNRLANGGTYPTNDKFRGEAACGNTWAGSTKLELVGALNYKASPTRQPNAFKQLNAVCSELAGLPTRPDQVEAVVALRTIIS